MSDFLATYRAHAAERAALGIPPLPLDAKQVAELIELIKNPPAGEDAFLMDLLTHRVPPGVDDAAKVKASFLAAVAHGDLAVGLVSKAKATELLGTMVGGYNVKPLIDLLDDKDVAGVAAEGLKKTLLMFDAFHDVAEKCKAGNAKAKEVMQSWADAEWFTTRPEVPKSITVTVERRVMHAKYGKFVKRSSKFLAHDEKGDAHIGDTVRIAETRPMSKLKRWRLVEIVERAK